MARITMDWTGAGGPRRGDVLWSPNSNYLVLSSVLMKRRDPNAGKKFKLLVVRRTAEEDREEMQALDDALTRSAARRGGRQIIHFTWNSRKKAPDVRKPAAPWHP